MINLLRQYTAAFTANSARTKWPIDKNEAPVIGILSQQLPGEFSQDPRFNGYNSYIMESYVNWVEAVGARVVPIIMNEPWEVTENKIRNLNGLIFPGGDGDYLEWGGPMFDLAVEMNETGQVYPVWGTCLGFESMTIWASQEGPTVMQHYYADQISLPIEFIVDPESSLLYKSLGQSAYLFQDFAMTYNNHVNGIDPQKFVTDSKLKESFKVTAVSQEPEGEQRIFTASIEGKSLPFFGTQFHPEKVTSMYNDDSDIDHSWTSIEMHRHLVQTFISFSRQNENTFGNFTQTQAQLIQNYKLIVTDDYLGNVYVFK